MTYATAIAQHGPTSGPFVCEFSLPLSAPPTLRGPNGEVATRIRTVGEESAVYAMATIAEALVPFRRASLGAPLAPGEQVYDLPIAESDVDLPPRHVSLALIEHVMEILPDVAHLGLVMDKVSQVATGHSHVHDAIECVWSSATAVLRGWATNFAGMPWVRWRFAWQLRNGQGSAVPLDIRWPSTVRVTRPAAPICDFLGIGDADVVVELKWSGEQGPFAAMADLARANAARGPWFGVPHKWSGEILGWPVVEGIAPIARMVDEIIESGNPAPWGGEPRPNDAGVRPWYGHAFTGVVWRAGAIPDPRVLRCLLGSARLWCKRPHHLLEPGDVTPLRFTEDRVAQFRYTMGLQPKTQTDAAAFGVGPRYGGATSQGFSYMDAEHRGFLPALAACLTGDEISVRLADSWLACELYEISAQKSFNDYWRGFGSGRGAGRPIHCGGLAARITTDDHLREAWNEASAYRTEAMHRWMPRGPRGPVCGHRWNSDREFGIGTSAITPYEGCITGASQWEEWNRLGRKDEKALRNAYDLGRTGATAVLPAANGRPDEADVAYWMLWQDGAPPSDRSQTGGMNEAFEDWLVVGLVVYILAAKEMADRGLLTPQDAAWDSVYLPIARRAIPAITKGLELFPPGEMLAAMHGSMALAYPELTRPIG